MLRGNEKWWLLLVAKRCTFSTGVLLMTIILSIEGALIKNNMETD